jgi:outer membrane lipoprotein-sorting protein
MVRTILCCIGLALCAPFGSSGTETSSAGTPPALSAAQIIERNVAARGGLEAWRAVQTMSFTGKMDAGGKENVQLPFVIEMKRPHRSRVEIEFAKDKAIQVYDGTKGWKLRPFLNRRDIEPYTNGEMKAASMEEELDGPLVDYAAKGTQVEVAGIDKLDGRDAYNLKLTTKNGQTRHLWVDAQTFLEVRIEGVPRRMDGKMRTVQVSMLDYRLVNGLMVPYVLETTVQGGKQPHKMVIDSVQVNPRLEDSLFAKPNPSGK